MTNDKQTLLYILAPSFSGSTLLTYLLAQHSDISTIGELKATKMGDVSKYHCSCGSLINECGFWLAVKSRARAAGIDFSVEDFGTVFAASSWLANKVIQASVRSPFFESLRDIAIALIPRAARARDAVVRQNLELAKIVCNIQGGKIFLDGSKDSNRLRHLMDSGRWDVRVIYLQRNGHGVSNSFRSHRSTSFSTAIETWHRNVTELQNMRKRLPSASVIDIHYEDLCQQPNETFARIWDWLGVSDQQIQSMNFKQGDYHILGNTMRLSNVAEIRFDEKWRTLLTAEEKALFAKMGGRLNSEIGYV